MKEMMNEIEKEMVQQVDMLHRLNKALRELNAFLADESEI